MDIALINGESIDMLNKTIVKKNETKNLLLPIWIKQILRFIFNQVE